jgi:hypothetical protein
MRAGIGPLGATRGLGGAIGCSDGSVVTWAVCTPDENFSIEDTPEATATGADDTTALDVGGVTGAEAEGAVATMLREDTTDAFSLSISVLSTIHFNHSGLE